MTKEELLLELKKCQNNLDTEEAHAEADGLLLEFINDQEISDAYSAIKKWYA